MFRIFMVFFKLLVWGRVIGGYCRGSKKGVGDVEVKVRLFKVLWVLWRFWVVILRILESYLRF